MCRIAGLINPYFEQSNLQHHIQKMCDVQAHGGPDGEGYFVDESVNLALGHRRLSLIDLSNAGHQPMQYQHLHISFNGEIYNYQEIRNDLIARGHQFHSHSDTEVILHAYQEWGTACFKLFNGMFAIAIYDQYLKKLILARDVAGIKPLYYFQQNQQFVFASEVKAFAASGLKIEDDPNWKIYFLSFGFIPEPHTTLKNVKSLAPGKVLIYNLQTQQSEIETFESLIFSSQLTNEEEVNQLINSTLKAAVKRHLISDAPIGVFLSGGIDSSIISLLAAQNSKQPIQTLSVSFNEDAYDESHYQKIIQQKINSQHTHYTITKKEYLDALPQLKQAFDQPSNDAVNSWFISRCAKQNGLKAVLSGLGGDELFGGYPSFKRIDKAIALRKLPLQLFNIADHLSNDKLKKLLFLKEERTYADYLFLRGFYTPKTISKLLDATEDEIQGALRKLKYENSPRKKEVPKNYVSWLEQNIYMRSQLLRDTDYMSMQHGIEVRVPFLDKDFLKLVHQIDPKIKFKGDFPKAALVNAFKDILPPEIYQRKKMGFTFPFQEWNKSHPEINKIAQHSNKQVAKLGKLFLNNKLHWSRCYALLQIENYLPLKDALFLTLKTFSHTGGIEKVNRVLMKAGTDIQSKNLIRFHAKSLYDHAPDEKYISKRRFEGFEGLLFPFIFKSVKKGIQCDVVMLSHINLALVGLLIKVLNPKTKLMLQAHGIEIWGKQSFLKRIFLNKVDLILPVSQFTKDNLVHQHHIDESKCLVFHNSLDPFFETHSPKKIESKLKDQYQILATDCVITTLTRLVSSEKYKGYDKVIAALAKLKQEGKKYKYLILGKYDEQEYQRVNRLIAQFDLKEEVKLCGFIPDEEISSYFRLANLFVMPSQKEGFGIVFIEAMACGLPVVGGNLDGSVDALANGDFGILIDPNDQNALIDAIQNYQHHPLSKQPQELINLVNQNFGYPQYKEKLEKLLLN
ncbi:asparagine synthase (glutamine-hydrolyzing) [Pedobacter alpinus]|uniref:asparagine synthase (glutamine-hydrolyzing) n=1 Tax=Pedobacter alpinus TaxID=1590643 RepID=A0ABW5TPZ8_9SPHI